MNPDSQPARPALESVAAGQAAASTGLLPSLRRSMAILRYYRWDQIARRGASLVIGKIRSGATIDAAEPASPLQFQDSQLTRQMAARVMQHAADHPDHSRCSPGEGRFTLLNVTEETGQPVDWNQAGAGQSRLWQFHLQYHEYLLALVSRPESSTPQVTPEIAGFLNDWMDAHAPGLVGSSDDSWHPYCISRRVPVWICLLTARWTDTRTRTRLVESLFQQVEWLQRNLERDPGGNHLLENLTAVIQAGCCLEFDDARSWIEDMWSRLRRELEQQILPHGEHYERSPMYHSQVLGNLLRIACVSDRRFPELNRFCREQAQRLLDFRQAILHPDGDIPLLGDSGFGEGPGSGLIRDLAEFCQLSVPDPPDGVTECGPYWISRHGQRQDFLLFDRGPVGPRSLPAHAHCDLLNVVASCGGQRWLVDSGNFDYGEGSMRQYCRASLAHNVVTANGRSQCDVWSRFRMGQRGRPTGLDSGQLGSFDWATANHDGYRGNGIARLCRLVAVDRRQQSWICCDFAFGNGQPELVGYLHFFPGISIVPDSRDDLVSPAFRLTDVTGQRNITLFGVDAAEIREGWYCPAFGVRQPAAVLEYRQAGDSRRPLGWVLHAAGETVLVNSRPGNRVTIECPGSDDPFEWTFD